MYGRGRHGVAYGFVASMGFSRASAMALRSMDEFSSVSISEAGVRMLGSGFSPWDAESGVGEEALRLSFWVNSWSWASRESVRVVLCWGKRLLERERVRCRVRLNARRSCLRFPLRVEDVAGVVSKERA